MKMKIISKSSGMNKKGWIRIVEVVLAIMLISAVILIISTKQIKKVDISKNVFEKQGEILSIIGENEELRTEIIGGNEKGVNDLISKTIPNSWSFEVVICNIDEICNKNLPSDKDVYVSEIIVSANLTDYPNEIPKKLRFFIWSK